MDRNIHPDAEKALARAWYAALLDLYSTLLVGENTADRNRAAEILLDYSIRLGQSINAPYIPAGPDPPGEDEDDEEEEDKDD